MASNADQETTKDDISQLAQAEDTEWQTFHTKLAPFPHSFHLADQHTVTATQIQRLKRSLESALYVGYKTPLETARAKNFLAYLLVRQGLTEEAWKQTEDTLELQDQRHNLVALANKAVILWHMGRSREAEAHVRRLYEMETIADFEYLCVRAKAELAFCYSRMGPRFFSMAISVFKEVLVTAREPEKWLWTFGLGLSKRRALHQQNPAEHVDGEQRKVFFDTLQLFQEVIKNTHSTSLQAKAYAEIALLAHTAKDKQLKRDLVEKAGMSRLEAAEKALRLSGDDNSVLCKAGKVFRQATHLARAISLLEEAVSIRPSSTGYTQLGLAYRQLAESGGDEGNRFNLDRQRYQQLTEKGRGRGGRSQRYQNKGYEPEYKGRPKARGGRIERQIKPGIYTYPGNVGSTFPKSPHSITTSVPMTDPLSATTSDVKAAKENKYLKRVGGPVADEARNTSLVTGTPHAFSILDINISKAIHCLKQATSISEGENIWAKKALGEIYVSLQEHDNALEVFGGIRNSKRGPAETDLRIEFLEQMAQILTLKSMRNDEAQKKEQLARQAENMFYIALMKRAQSVSQSFGAREGETWESLFVLLKTVDQFEQGKTAPWGKTAAAKFLRFISKGRQFLPFFNEIAQIVPREHDPRSLKSCIEQLVQEVEAKRKRKDYDKTLALIELLMCTSQGHAAMQLFNDPLYVPKLYIAAGKHALYHTPFAANMYFQSAFVRAVTELKPEATDSEDAETWNLMLIHDDGSKPQKKASTVANIFREACGLAVTRQDEDAGRDRASALRGIMHVMDRCQLVMVLTGDRQTTHISQLASHAARRKTTVVLLTEGDYVHEELTHHRRMVCPPELLQPKDTQSGKYSRATIRAICQIFSFLINTELPDFKKGSKEVASSPESPPANKDFSTQTAENLSVHGSSFIRSAQDARPKTSSTVSTYRLCTASTGRTDKGSSQKSVELGKPHYQAEAGHGSDDSESEITSETNNDGIQLCSANLCVDESESCSESGSPVTPGSPSSCLTLQLNVPVMVAENASDAQSNYPQTLQFLQSSPDSTPTNMVVPNEDTARGEVQKSKRSGNRTPVDVPYHDTMFHRTDTEISPHDYLGPTSKIEPPICSPRWQAVYSVSCEGGTFCKFGSDVTLCIPAGSVASQGPTVDIYTAVSTDVEFIWRTLRLTEEETVCSPLVEYSTNQEFRGFQKPVCVNLPLFLPPDSDPQLVRVYRVAHRPHGQVAVRRLRQHSTSSLSLSATQVMLSGSREATRGGQQLIKVIPHQHPYPQDDGQAFSSTLSQADPSRVPGIDQPPPKPVVNPDTQTHGGADQDKVPNHTLMKQTSDEALSTQSPIATEAFAADHISVEESNQPHDRTDYPPWEDGAHFQLKSDSTLCITTEHFSGYVCTYCGRSQGPPVLNVLACGSHRRDPGGQQQTATIAVHVWDRRMEIADFREDYGIGFHSQELRKMTLNLVDDIRDSLLYMCLVIRGRNKADWQHSVGDDDQPCHPIQQQHDLTSVLSCNYQDDCNQSTRSSRPITAYWVLETLANYHPGQWFYCTVRLCNIAATETPTWRDRMKVERTTSLPIEVEAIQGDSKHNGTDETAWRQDLLHLAIDKLNAIVQKLGYTSDTLRSLYQRCTSEEEFKQKLISRCVSSETNIRRLPGVLISLYSQSTSDTTSYENTKTSFREVIGVRRCHDHTETANNIKSASDSTTTCSDFNDSETGSDFIANSFKTKASFSLLNSPLRTEYISHVKQKVQASTRGFGDKDMLCTDWLNNQLSSAFYGGPGSQSILDDASYLSSLSGHVENPMNNQRDPTAIDVENTYADNMCNATAGESSMTGVATCADKMDATVNGSSVTGVSTAPPQQFVRESSLNPNASPFNPRK